MKLYNFKSEGGARPVVLDDMILTKDMPTTAGSRMLDGYKSLFDAEAVTRLTAAGYTVAGKAAVGEFGIDLIGESSYEGALVKEGALVNAAAEIVLAGEAEAAITLDVNGATRRAAAQAGLVSVKPTYGTVSRYGTIPAACSGECVSVTAKTADACLELLTAISGHDAKDGTSLSDAECASALECRAPKKVLIVSDMLALADADVVARVEAAAEALSAAGVTVERGDAPILLAARAAWNILMSAETCNNVSRYDGVKYGYRAKDFVGIDGLYTNSRSEAFGKLLKMTIIYGSETLSTENYMKVYDKALRTRRVIVEALGKIFGEYDAILMPATSRAAYAASDVAVDECFVENIYTAPASISGMPSVVVGGAMLVGAAFSDGMLLSAAKIIEGEGK